MYLSHKNRGRLPFIDHKIEDIAAKNEIIKDDISVVKILVNKSPSQRFSTNRSLTLLGMECKRRRSLSVFFTEFSLFIISSRKFSATF